MTGEARNRETMYDESSRKLETQMAVGLMVRKVARQVVRMLPEVDGDEVVQQVADEVRKQLIAQLVREVMERAGNAIVGELADQIVTSWPDRT